MTSTTEKQQIYNDFVSRFDGNSDDQVTKAEFKGALEAEGLPADTIAVMFDQVFANWDANADQKLAKKEIKRLAEEWASFPGDQSSTA